MSKNVNDLFANALEEGALTPISMQALQVMDIGQQINAGLGVDVADVQASEVFLVTMMPDDSGSIRFAGNSQAVRDGHNTVLNALQKCKEKDGILAHNRYLNGTVLYDYRSIDDAIEMDSHNYDPNEGTPLYDQAVVLLGTVLAKTQEFANEGVPVRTATLIITDGADMHSRKADASTVKKIVDDMLRSENHIIAAMGVDDGGGTDFHEVFREMGIRDEWILTPANTPSEIRKAFQVFSQSAVRASQGAASFSKTALGGFTEN